MKWQQELGKSFGPRERRVFCSCKVVGNKWAHENAGKGMNDVWLCKVFACILKSVWLTVTPNPLLLYQNQQFLARRWLMSASSIQNHNKSNIVIIIKACAVIKTSTVVSTKRYLQQGCTMAYVCLMFSAHHIFFFYPICFSFFLKEAQFACSCLL